MRISIKSDVKASVVRYMANGRVCDVHIKNLLVYLNSRYVFQTDGREKRICYLKKKKEKT